MLEWMGPVGSAEILNNIILNKLPCKTKSGLILPGREQIKLLVSVARPIFLEETLYELLRPLRFELQKGCWFRSEDWSYYSKIKIGNHTRQAHRVSFEAYREDILKGNEICHNCDRKGCINPFHLFQGTHSDNVQDGINKHRIFSIRSGK